MSKSFTVDDTKETLQKAERQLCTHEFNHCIVHKRNRTTSHNLKRTHEEQQEGVYNKMWEPPASNNLFTVKQRVLVQELMMVSWQSDFQLLEYDWNEKKNLLLQLVC
jgi:hypothetical protein